MGICPATGCSGSGDVGAGPRADTAFYYSARAAVLLYRFFFSEEIDLASSIAPEGVSPQAAPFTRGARHWITSNRVLNDDFDPPAFVSRN